MLPNKRKNCTAISDPSQQKIMKFSNSITYPVSEEKMSDSSPEENPDASWKRRKSSIPRAPSLQCIEAISLFGENSEKERIGKRLQEVEEEINKVQNEMLQSTYVGGSPDHQMCSQLLELHLTKTYLDSKLRTLANPKNHCKKPKISQSPPPPTTSRPLGKVILQASPEKREVVLELGEQLNLSSESSDSEYESHTKLPPPPQDPMTSIDSYISHVEETSEKKVSIPLPPQVKGPSARGVAQVKDTKVRRKITAPDEVENSRSSNF